MINIENFRVKLNQSYTVDKWLNKNSFDLIKNLSRELPHNQTEIHNDSDMIEIKTNEDVFNEMKFSKDFENQDNILKNSKLNISINSIKSNNSRNLNDSETNSVVDLKNLNRGFKLDPNICTLESLNSTDFKKDLNLNDSCFYSQLELNDFKINVKNSKL